MLVTTKKGELDDSLLIRRDFAFENEIERTTAVEYWLPLAPGTPIAGTLCQGDGNGEGTRYEVFVFDASGRAALAELVHRSAHVTLKQVPQFATGEVGEF